MEGSHACLHRPRELYVQVESLNFNGIRELTQFAAILNRCKDFLGRDDSACEFNGAVFDFTFEFHEYSSTL